MNSKVVCTNLISSGAAAGQILHSLPFNGNGQSRIVIPPLPCLCRTGAGRAPHRLSWCNNRLCFDWRWVETRRRKGDWNCIHVVAVGSQGWRQIRWTPLWWFSGAIRYLQHHWGRSRSCTPAWRFHVSNLVTVNIPKEESRVTFEAKARIILVLVDLGKTDTRNNLPVLFFSIGYCTRISLRGMGV
jgi:hypothetical protein